jgi:hypothetical protein
MPQPCPAVSPDHANETERRWLGAVRKWPTCVFADDGRRPQILESDAIENILARRQILQQRLRGEVAFRQRVDGDYVADVDESAAGRDLDQHARRAVGSRPDHTGIGRDISRLDAVRDKRPVRRAAQIWFGDAAKNADRRRRGRCGQQPAPCQRRAIANRSGHWTSAVESQRTMAAVFDSASTVMRLDDDSKPIAAFPSSPARHEYALSAQATAWI